MLKSAIQTKVIKDLKLLSYTKNLFERANFENTFLFGVQHLYLTTYELFRSLIDLGFRPENIALIGKCYSTDPRALKALKSLGIDVCESSIQFDSHKSYNEQVKENIKKFFEKKMKERELREFNKVILLDDGGALLNEVIPELNFYVPNMIGIEQTSSGYNLLKKGRMKFPVINVARSHIKLIHETPLITRIIAENTLECLLKLKIAHPPNILIIGRGFIGEGIYCAIKNIFPNISFYDHSEEKTHISKKDFKDRLQEFDVLIGCTGRTSISSGSYSFLKKDAILISASSSDAEFDSVTLRRKVKWTDICHQNIYTHNIHLINCGFPVNFSSDFANSDPDEFELTRSILLSSIIQGNNQNHFPPTFIPLDRKYQQKISKKYLAMYAFRINSFPIKNH